LLAHIDLKRLDQRLAQFLANGFVLLGRFAIDGPLDVEQGVDASYNLDRNGRERDSPLGCRLPSPGSEYSPRFRDACAPTGG
jgi:hypothetical protein